MTPFQKIHVPLFYNDFYDLVWSYQQITMWQAYWQLWSYQLNSQGRLPRSQMLQGMVLSPLSFWVVWLPPNRRNGTIDHFTTVGQQLFHQLILVLLSFEANICIGFYKLKEKNEVTIFYDETYPPNYWAVYCTFLTFKQNGRSRVCTKNF